MTKIIILVTWSFYFHTVCATGNFGKDCSSICTCVTQNTVNCSNVDGACTCKSGWRGKNCSEDVDECTQTPSLCVANSTCSNSPGSYRCVCNPGYKTLSDGSCTGKPANTTLRLLYHDCKLFVYARQRKPLVHL